MPNPDEEKEKLEKAAIEVTGSAKRNVFFITNSVTDQEDLACVYTKRVLQMVEQALKCGEWSKIRQLQRPVRVPVEKTEPPALKEPVENFDYHFDISSCCSSTFYTSKCFPTKRQSGSHAVQVVFCQTFNIFLPLYPVQTRKNREFHGMSLINYILYSALVNKYLYEFKHALN